MQSSLEQSSKTPIRQLGINLNHWYVVASSAEVKTQPLAVTLWHQDIVVYRDAAGKIHALEDRCPHRHVKLSHGKVLGNALECAYHGWQFNSAGECSEVPYLAENQKLPNCKIRVYPVKEQDGFIWLFPGEIALAKTIPPLSLPEWDHLNYIASFAVLECKAHYSYLIENIMDMYHGHLHLNLQAWANPVLQSIDEDEHHVTAHYQAESYYKIDKIWSISQLFIPALRKLHPEPLDVSYVYPHWVSTLGKDFKICCLLCPISETHTRAYLLHFTSLHSFWRLHKLPTWFRQWVKDLTFNAAKGLLEGLIKQDVEMIEEEQQAFLEDPNRRSYELNRALVSVQRLMRNQVEKSSF